jgi:hypothetical protein
MRDLLVPLEDAFQLTLKYIRDSRIDMNYWASHTIIHGKMREARGKHIVST